MTTTYFRTRDLAKAGVKELNGSFKDFGTTAPKGERWAVIVADVAADTEQNINEQLKAALQDHQLIDGADIAKVLNQPAGLLQYEDLVSPNNKPVQVFMRRSHVPIRLVKHLAKTA